MTDVITGLIKGNESLNRQFVDNLTTIDVRRIINENIPLDYQTTKVYSQAVDSSVFILSHYIQSELVATTSAGGYWLTDGTTGFTEVVSRVVSKNNIFKERFIHTDFIDTSTTTAAITTSSGRIDFTAAEIYQTSVIALNNEAYVQVKLTPEGVYTQLTPSVSFDGGSTFNTAVWETPLVVSNSSKSGIIIKVTENTSIGLTMPVTMPVTFTSDTVSDYLTNLIIEYN